MVGPPWSKSRPWCSVSAFFIILLVTAASVITWVYATARWHSRVTELEAGWRHTKEQLLTEMSNLQDDVDRAHSQARQLADGSVTWARGYKQGCNDMIRAMAALRGEVVTSQDPPEDATDSR
jgi:hypothetical protein